MRSTPDFAEKVLAERMQFDDALNAAHKKRVEETTELDKLARIDREAPDLRELAGRDLDEAIMPARRSAGLVRIGCAAARRIRDERASSRRVVSRDRHDAG